jgi:hypothetical protein
MKLTPLTQQHTRRMKIIITEDQLKRLATHIIAEEEQGTIKKTYLVKQTNNVKKK